MKASLFIARRYFLSRKKQNFINILSIIALVGVSLGTIALVVVLSVFNGLEGLLRSLFGSFDPDIQILAAEGKSFDYNEDMLAEIESVPGVAILTEVIEDNALIKYRNKQSVVKIKGVTPSLLEREDFERNIVQGIFTFKDSEGAPKAIVGRGIQYKLNLPLGEGFMPMQVIYPKDIKGFTFNPEKSLITKYITASSVFALEEYYDNNFVFVPLEFAEDLFAYHGKRTAYEIIIEEGYETDNVQSQLKTILGPNFKVLNADEQHEALYRAIKVEKLFVNLAFIFILIVVSFNIFFALSMLALEKKKDISMLFAMGANSRTVTQIFIIEGMIIGLSGMFLGLLIGYILCYGQENYGWVSMGLEMAVADAYPLEIRWYDFFGTAVLITIITFLSSLNPAILARKSSDLKALYNS